MPDGAAPPSVRPPPAPAEWGARALVLGVWALMAIAFFSLVAICGANFPLWDEWQLVGALIGKERLTFDWFWGQHGEHRLVLPKLVAIGLATVSDNDFRAGMVASVVCLVTLTGIMIATARRLRGWSSYTDIFFPVVLLHFAHKWNVLQGWHIHYVMVVLLAGVILSVIARSGRSLGLRRVLGISTCLFLLSLEGAPGVILVPPLALWLACAGAAAMREREGRCRVTGLLTVGLAIGNLLMVVLYLRGLRQTGYPTPDTRAWLEGALMFLSTALGAGTVAFWPVAAAVVLTFVVAAAVLVAAAWTRWPQERIRALGLLTFLGTCVLLAAGVSWGRSGLRADLCLESRYLLLAAPGLLTAYLAAILYFGASWGRLLQFLMCLAGVLVLPLNLQDGLACAVRHRAACRAFRDDLLAGLPPRFLLRRHGWLLPQWRDTDFSPEAARWVESCMLLLRQARIGLYAQLQAMPLSRDVTLRAEPAELSGAVWRDGALCACGPDARAIFRLERRRKVLGIIVNCSFNYGNEEVTPTTLTVAWRPEKPPYAARTVRTDLSTAKIDWSAHTWINDRIDEFELRPGPGPCVCRISSIVLVVPPND